MSLKKSEHPALKVLTLTNGAGITQCIFVAAKLGIADLLAGGEQNCDTLAEKTNTHASTLYRLMKILCELDIFVETKPSFFALNEYSDCLRENSKSSVKNYILLRADHEYKCWEHLLDSIVSGKSSFEHVYGMNQVEYLKENPCEGIKYDKAISDLTSRNDEILADSYDFSSLERIIDLGGGLGGLLKAILIKNPNLRGILFEQNYTIKKAKEIFLQSGITNCDFVVGDFFEKIPSNGDLYILKNIIINWPEENAIDILRQCGKCMPRHSKLIIIDQVIETSHNLTSIRDLKVFTLFGGRLRSEKEFYDLCEQAGLKILRIIKTKSLLSIIETATIK